MKYLACNKKKKRKDNYAVYSKSLQKMYTQLQV